MKILHKLSVFAVGLLGQSNATEVENLHSITTEKNFSQSGLEELPLVSDEKWVRLAGSSLLETAINRTSTGQTSFLVKTQFLQMRLIGDRKYQIKEVKSIIFSAIDQYFYMIKNEGMTSECLAFQKKMLNTEDILKAVLNAK